MALRWYVAQCLPRCEGWVLQGTLGLNFEAYWPRYEMIRRRAAGSKYYRGIFPGYMFVSFDEECDDWRLVCRVSGMRRLLGANEYGARALPHGFVENMIEHAPSGIIEQPAPAENKFAYGDKVKIVDGAMAGRVGIFQHTEKDRVALLLTLLGRETKVTLPLCSVQYVNAFS